MAAESEIQEFLNEAGAVVAAGYNAAMRDGSIPAIGREAVKDVRNTINEIFFGRGERGAEPGTPLNPLFHDIVQARKQHATALASPDAPLSPSPADLTERTGPAAPQQADRPEVSPADLVERSGTVHGQQGISQARPDMPAGALADARDAVAAAKDAIKDSQTDVGREQLGQLPTQDPLRQRHKL